MGAPDGPRLSDTGLRTGVGTCCRSESSPRARPGTTSTRPRDGSMRCRASATASRTTTPAAPRRVASGAERRRGTLGLDGRSTAMRCGVSSRGDPWSERRCGPAAGAVAGFDLTFSAPKSVSVIFGVGDPDVRLPCGRRTTRRSARRSATSSDRLLRFGAAGAARRSRGRRPRRGGVPAPHVAGGRSAAAHARPRRQPRPRPRRAVVGAGRAAALRPRARRELRLPGGPSWRADARRSASSGRRCETGSPRSTACRAGDAGVQPAAGRDRGGARSTRPAARAPPRPRRWRRGSRRRRRRCGSAAGSGAARRGLGFDRAALARLLGRAEPCARQLRAC